MRRSLLLFSFAFLFVVGCEPSATEPDKRPAPGVVPDHAEAEAIALQLSGELRPPADLADRIATELQDVRETFAATAPEILEIRYSAPWSLAGLLLMVDEATARAIRNEEYTAWDDLNEEHELVQVEPLSRIDVLHLRFASTLHPCRLRELYLQLPGMLQAEPNGIVGDGPKLYVRQEGELRSYLFRDAHGDCLAGCIYERFWYVEMTDEGPEYVGAWDPQEQPTPPDWWARARGNIDRYVYQCHK